MIQQWNTVGCGGWEDKIYDVVKDSKRTKPGVDVCDARILE